MNAAHLDSEQVKSCRPCPGGSTASGCVRISAGRGEDFGNQHASHALQQQG